MTPVLPHAPGAIFLILVVWSILLSMTSSQENSSMSHSSKGPKLMWAKAYKVPEIYPQEMGIISNIHALIKFKKSQNRLLFKQNYWQELSKPLIKKPACFQAGFSTSSSIITITQVFDFYVFKICISYNRHYVCFANEKWEAIKNPGILPGFFIVRSLVGAALPHNPRVKTYHCCFMFRNILFLYDFIIGIFS